MDRSLYLRIRNNLDLKRQSSALALHYSVDAALVGCSVVLGYFFAESVIRFASIPLIAMWIFRNFSLMHDAVHGAVAKRRWLNDSVGFLAGAVCFLPFEAWKKSHLEHHFWTGNIEKDPVMAILIAFPKFTSRQQAFLNFFWHRWFPVLSTIQVIVFWALSLRMFAQAKKTPRAVFNIAWPLVFWGSLFTLAPTSFSIGVLVPAILLYHLTVEVVNFPHHLQLPQHRGETRFPVWEQYQSARSCVYPRWFARWVVLNFNYHSEHHMFPEVPWYHLDKIQPELEKALGPAYNVDPYFEWILENKPKPLDVVLGPPPQVEKEKAA